MLSRLNASPAEAGTHQSAMPTLGDDVRGSIRGPCLECGGLRPASERRSDFCCTPCRQAFNNRRLQRGAELYDLIMALRFDRKTATALKVWRLVNRLAGIFRHEDNLARGGRPSWRHPREILARRPDLRADTLIARKRPS